MKAAVILRQKALSMGVRAFKVKPFGVYVMVLWNTGYKTPKVAMLPCKTVCPQGGSQPSSDWCLYLLS